MKWYRFQKIKNKMLTYFLSERELAEAFVIFIRGRYKYVQPDSYKMISDFFDDIDCGLGVNQSDLQKTILLDYLDRVLMMYKSGQFNYLFEPNNKYSSLIKH